MRHSTETIIKDGCRIDIDKKIINLVRELWRLGIQTGASCQGNPELYGPLLPPDDSGIASENPRNSDLPVSELPVSERNQELMAQMCHAAYVMFPTLQDFLKFMNLVGKQEPGYYAPSIDEERDNLTDRQYGDAYSKWEYTIGIPYWNNTGFGTSIAVHFPPQDIPLIEDRLRRQ